MPLAGALVTVRQTGTTSPVPWTLYAASGSVLANPLTADLRGVIDFYLDTDERVDLYATFPGYDPVTATVEVVSQQTLTGPTVVGGLSVSSGGVAVTGTPKAWDTAAVVDFGTGTAAIRQSGASVLLAQNAWITAGGAWTQSVAAPATLYVQAAGVHSWYSDPSAGTGPDRTYTPTLRMTLDAGGMLGVGTTPAGWGTYRVVQVGPSGVVAGALTGAAAILARNAWNDGVNWRPIAADTAELLSLTSNTLTFYTAPNGTTLVLTTRLQVDPNGLGVGALATATSQINAVRNQNSPNLIAVSNADPGTNAYAGLLVVAQTYQLLVGAASAGYATAPFTNKAFVQTNSAAGLMLQDTGGGPIQFYVGSGTTLAGQWTGGGALEVWVGAASVATTGGIRLPNNQAIVARATNSVDRPLIGLDTNNFVQVGQSAGAQVRIGYGGNTIIGGAADGVGFYNAGGVARQTITGSRAANAALASLLTALGALGLVADSTTA